MHFLVTGHTGFKGAWLTLMLTRLGHDVSGLALEPVAGALFATARLSELLRSDARGDVRDAELVRRAVQDAQPDAVIHMAAQSLVRVSYAQPRATIDTNVLGTLSILEAVAACDRVKALVVVTTDKVYRNVSQAQGYVESDPLGGHDPYSASKAMADLLVESWVSSFDMCPTAVARAGNVIGGGDVSPDRLLPDLLAAFASGTPAALRFPDAVRPWQHVLDCLHGYVRLTDALLAGSGMGAWNFGPDAASFRTVGEVADLAAACWGADARWQATDGQHPHEAALLTLDASRARAELGWGDALDFSDAVRWTVDWTQAVRAGVDPRVETLRQIDAHAELCAADR